MTGLEKEFGNESIKTPEEIIDECFDIPVEEYENERIPEMLLLAADDDDFDDDDFDDDFDDDEIDEPLGDKDIEDFDFEDDDDLFDDDDPQYN